MEFSDMLDVLHYYFEEDFSSVSEEAAARRSAVRENVYPTLYDLEYKYPVAKQSGPKTFNPDDYEDADDDGYGTLPDPFSPQKAKPFIPPTKESADPGSPFGSILDAPLK